MHSHNRPPAGLGGGLGGGGSLDAGGGGGLLDMHSAVGDGPPSIFSQPYHLELDPLQVGVGFRAS